MEYEITDDAALFREAKDRPRINYSNDPIPGSIQVKPQGLLFANDIVPQETVVERNDEWGFVFWNKGTEAVPFDLFSAAFYLLSRYEEYTITQRDSYGRFEAASGLAYRSGFLQLPLIEVWIERLKQVLQVNYPQLVFKEDAFTALSTIDIDFAYLYKGIGLKRWCGKLLKHLLAARFGAACRQLAVAAGMSRDPYDTYHAAAEVPASLAYFVLLGRKGGHDKACLPRAMRPLIAELRNKGSFIGIHPSLASSGNPAGLRMELDELEGYMGKKVVDSRNHFLRLSLPGSYRDLAEAGISADYTMMYADAAGFRASTCKPFCFYDLEVGQQTSLTVYSTCLMDVTLKDYMSYSPDQASEMAAGLYRTVKKFGGHYITLWHNSSLSGHGEWAGWKRVYFSLFNPGH